jgi:hypothetical protein
MARTPSLRWVRRDAAALQPDLRGEAREALTNMLRDDKSTGRAKLWLETLVITASGPLAGWAFHPSDPFWMRERMPWLLLLPLLCGAQHGVAHAAVSCGLLSLMAAAHVVMSDQLGQLSAELFTSWCGGGLVVGLVAGQFRDSHERRRSQLRTEVSQLSERLQRAERAGQIMTLSHAQLEERLAAMRWSLASSLSEVQRRMQQLSTRRELGEVLLEALASQGMVQAASLYWIGVQQLMPTPVATLGRSPSSSQLHPLLQRTWKTRRLTTVVDAKAGQDGEVLAAVPVITAGGVIVGVVAIHQMPFMAFQMDQLSQLLTIAGQLGDVMHERLGAVRMQRDVVVAPSVVPTQPPASIAAPSALRVRTQVLRPAPITLSVPAPIGHAHTPPRQRNSDVGTFVSPN